VNVNLLVHHVKWARELFRTLKGEATVKGAREDGRDRWMEKRGKRCKKRDGW
jgi:hypothetical protein